MEKNITIDEILEGYPELINVAELLDSDILVLPLHKDGAFGEDQQFGIRNKKLKIKYYTEDKPTCRFQASVDTLINLGALIVSSIAALVAISDSIRKNHKDDNISITIYVNSGNNVYIDNAYKGVGSDVEKYILKLQEFFK